MFRKEKERKKRKKERKKTQPHFSSSSSSSVPTSVLCSPVSPLLLSPLLYFAPLFLSSYQDDCHSLSLLSLFCLSVSLLHARAARIRIQKYHRKSGGRERERERELHLCLSLVFI
jgi:hypothetical protein